MKELEVVQSFIKHADIFYVATANNNIPQCRPFGATILFNDKLYLITKATKNVAKQIADNNRVCIVCCDKAKDYQWLRLNCNLISDNDNFEAKQKFLDTFDDLEEEGYALNNPDFQIYYADNLDATIHDYDGGKRKII
jgi:uncharacterized pyridoxamine 5'-phosphate oxidase family protein